MSTISLLGLDLTVEQDGTVSPPAIHGLTVNAWAVHIADKKLKTDLELKVEASSIKIIMRATMRVVKNGVTWRLEDGVPESISRLTIEQNGQGSGTLSLFVPPLQLAGNATAKNAVTVKGGWIGQSFGSAATHILQSSELPLEISLEKGRAVPNLGAMRIQLEENFCAAQTGIVAKRPDGITAWLFERRHISRAHTLDLSATIGTLQLEFDSQPAKFGLPLNADIHDRAAAVSAENPVWVPIRADNYRLITDLERNGSGTILSATTLAGSGGAGGPTMTLFGLLSANNKPIEVELSQPLSLSARLHQNKQIGSLLVAASLPAEKGVRVKLACGAVHGLLAKARVESKGVAHLCCEHETQSHAFPGAVFPPVALRMLRDVTLPWIEFDTCLEHPKAGDAYTAGSECVDVWKFAGGKIGLALIADNLARHAVTRTNDVRQLHYAHLNARAATLSHQLGSARHDTSLIESPAGGVQRMTLTQLFAPETHSAVTVAVASVNVQADGLQPAAYEVIRDYGLFKVEVKIPAGKAPDYLILRKSGTADFTIHPPAKPLAPDSHRFPELKFEMPVAHDEPATDLPLAVLKLSERYSLKEIFERESLGLKPVRDLEIQGRSADFLNDVVDQPIKAKAWLGLILFNLDFIFSDHPVIRSLLPAPPPGIPPTLRFRYLALTPSKSGDENGTSLNGRVWYQNQEDPKLPVLKDDDDETTYRFDFVDALWRDSRLVRFDAGATLSFQSVFGMQHPKHKGQPKDWNSVKLRGRLEVPPRNEGEPRIRFSGEIEQEIALLEPRNPPGLIEQIWFKGAEVVYDPGKGARIDFDGDIKLGKLDLDPKFNDFFNVGSSGNGRISFEKLGIGLPETMSLDLSWLRISYPAIKLDVNVPHFQLFNLPQLALKIRSIGVDWENKFGWEKTLVLKDWNVPSKRIFLVDIRLTAADLPELAGKLFDKLNLDFSLGLGQLLSGSDFSFSPNALKIGLSAAGFDNFHLDLARIIELHITKLALEKKTYKDGTETPWIIMEGVELKILDKTILSDLTLAFFSVPKTGRRGFVCFFGNPLDGTAKPPPPGNSFLGFSWLLIGNNLTLDKTLAKDLISIDTDTSKWSTSDETRTSIAKSIQDESIFPLDINQNAEPWLFAAGFSVLKGLLDGKFLFQDRAFYGLMLRGTLFDEWFGYPFAISCLYLKRERPEEDSFIVSFTVPAVQTGSFRFMGGVVSVEIAANGSFVLDVGFPWMTPNGIRAWNRTFGAICTPFQGSGGLYVRYRKTTVVHTNDKHLIFAGGYALQAGLGASFGGGIFEVWVRAGIYVVAEGAVVLNLDNKALEGLRLVGAVGILVEGHGSLRWWIISAHVSVIAQAEARATILWGLDPENVNLPRVNDVALQLDFMLSARASASACIGSGWFKVCRGISTSISMPFRHRLVLR
ncbi:MULTISPECIES: hypothetical protein [unclassified Pseudomonas]